MSQDTRTFYLNQKSDMAHLLEITPAQFVFERIGYERRLKQAEDLLSKMEKSSEPARTQLIFKGKPVVGSYGVMSSFAADATAAFVKVVSSVRSSFEESRSRKPRGAPKQDMLIVGTVVGSFGFVLEEMVPEGPTDGKAPEASVLAGVADEEDEFSQLPLQDPVELAQDLIQSTIDFNDDELAEAASEVSPKALQSVREFLNVLSTNNAYCSIKSPTKEVVFTSSVQVARAKERLKEKDIKEDEETLEGTFTGFLPLKGTFEFTLSDGVVISGRAPKSVDKVDSINLHLDEPTEIVVKAVRVRDGKPKYTLRRLPKFEEKPSFES